jgi:REP element-mobilizing transposase RayT
MARPLRLEYPGALYHATSRGNAREPIYADDHDRLIFLDVLATTVGQFRWRMYAYCMMGNHYHLLLETPEPNLSRGMRQLNGVYTQRFNRRHDRVGHVFQGRFKAIVVDRDSYLLELCRYVVLNPVRAGLLASPEPYPWSSYRATIGLEQAPAWLDVEAVLRQFGPTPERARRRYSSFVYRGIGQTGPWEHLRGQLVLGDEGFAERLRQEMLPENLSPEIPRAQRHAGRPPLETLLGQVTRASRAERDRAFAIAHIEHGYTLAEIARAAGVHYSTVSKGISKDRVSKDRETVLAGVTWPVSGLDKACTWPLSGLDKSGVPPKTEEKMR